MVMTLKKRHVKAIIQLRRGKEEEWANRDPILQLGEPAFSTDRNLLKIGDGTSHWSELDYIGMLELLALQEEIDNLDINDFIDGMMIINCGTSTTVIGE